VGAEHEAVGGEQERARHGDRGAGPDASLGLPLADPPRGQLGDRLLAAATPGQQVGQEELGVELDDHIRFVTEAMRPIAGELGLRQSAEQPL
jgi:hypothetical protein